MGPQSNEAVGKLSDLLSDPEQRRSFAKDPHATLAGADIAADDVPPALINTLAGLTAEEWEVLDRVRAPLDEAGGDVSRGVTFL